MKTRYISKQSISLFVFILLIIGIYSLFGSKGEEDLDVDDDIVEDFSDFNSNQTFEIIEGCRNRKQEHPGILPGPRVQFIHIPKAGGTSIQLALQAWSQQARLKYDVVNGGSIHKCPANARHFSVLMGHRGFGFCGGIAAQGLFTFAAFREAVPRMVSLYDYNLKKIQDPVAVRLFSHGSLNHYVQLYNSTTDIIEEGEKILRFSGSQQTRFMCGYDCFSRRSEMSDEEMLSKALENLKKLDAIGVTVHLTRLIPQLRFHLTFIPKDFHKWNRQNELPHGQKSHIDEKTFQILSEWGKLDQEFYRHAYRLFLAKDDQIKRCMKG